MTEAVPLTEMGEAEMNAWLQDRAAFGSDYERSLALRIIATIDKDRQEIARLTQLVYVPGQWRCAKCKFVCQKMVLRASDGAVGVQADTKTEPCPNGCGPLWPMTERQSADELCDRLDAMFAEEKKLKTEAASLREKLARAREALEPFAEAAQDKIAVKEANSNTYFMFDGEDLRKAAEVHASLSTAEKEGGGE